MKNNEDRALNALLKLGGAGTSKEIAQLLGWENCGGARRAGQIMGRLIEKHKVVRLERGRPVYALARGLLLASVRSPK